MVAIISFVSFISITSVAAVSAKGSQLPSTTGQIDLRQIDERTQRAEQVRYELISVLMDPSGYNDLLCCKCIFYESQQIEYDLWILQKYRICLPSISSAFPGRNYGVFKKRINCLWKLC